MKTILLQGVEIKIGSQVRFVNDTKLYTGIEGIEKPVLGVVYTVRDINEKGGFLLEEIENMIFEWYFESGELDLIAEPGFANWRFEPVKPVSKRKVVRIKIEQPVEERLYVEKTKPQAA